MTEQADFRTHYAANLGNSEGEDCGAAFCSLAVSAAALAAVFAAALGLG